MDRDMAESVVRQIRERLKELDETVKPRIADANPDARKLTKRDMPAVAQYMLQQYPPEPFVFPDGHIEVISPWSLALREVAAIEGGKELYRQLVKGLDNGSR